MIAIGDIRRERVRVAAGVAVVVNVQHDDRKPDSDAGLVRGGPDLAVVSSVTRQLRLGPRQLVLAFPGKVVLHLHINISNITKYDIFQ